MKQVSSVSSWQVIPLVCRGGRMNAFMMPLTTPSKDILACTWFTALHLFFSLPSPESKLAPQVITRLLQQSAFIWKALPRCDLHLPLPCSLSPLPPTPFSLRSLACHLGPAMRGAVCAVSLDMVLDCPCAIRVRGGCSREKLNENPAVESSSATLICFHLF